MLGSAMAQPLASQPEAASWLSQPEAASWLTKWLEACAELDRLQAQNPMLDAVIDEVDGRRIRVGDRWLHDFAS